MALPISPPRQHSLSAHPFPEESLIGFIYRLAERRHLRSGRRLAAQCGFRHLTNRPPPAWIDALAYNARLSTEELWAIANGPAHDAIANFRGTRLPSLVFDRRGNPDYRVCPDCLADNLFHRAIWDLSFIAICPVHLKVLADHCSSCGVEFRWGGKTMFTCKDCRKKLADMKALSVSEQEARGTKVVYGLLGDKRFLDEANYARSLTPFADLHQQHIIEFLYRVGLECLAPRRKILSMQHIGELAWEAHIALTKGLETAEIWPDRLFDILDSLRRRVPSTRSLALLRSVGALERWLDWVPEDQGKAIRIAAQQYRLTRANADSKD